jgi:hypothetical protein
MFDRVESVESVEPVELVLEEVAVGELASLVGEGSSYMGHRAIAPARAGTSASRAQSCSAAAMSN